MDAVGFLSRMLEPVMNVQLGWWALMEQPRTKAHMADVQPGRWHGQWRGRCSCGWRGTSRAGSAHAHAAVEKHQQEAI